MSIAVMNWVWTQSPTSGNERLVLLALADACSRDDGSGCWPSAATIGRKAGISDRTVRRVIARLEAGGHILVNRGGGRSANSYIVVMDIHSPGQAVSPDNPSGLTPCVRAGVTQPRYGTSDRAVSPDPSLIHHGTAAAPTPADEARPAARPAVGGVAARFFDSLGPGWLLTAVQRCRLVPAVTDAVAAGWDPGELAAFVGANSTGIRSPSAILAARLSPDELPAPRRAAEPSRKPWCGRCDPDTRFLLDEHGYPGDSPRRCPECGPGAARKDPA
jgi:hypothetical protein